MTLTTKNKISTDIKCDNLFHLSLVYVRILNLSTPAGVLEKHAFFGYWRDFVPPREYANCIQKGPSWNQTRNFHARTLWTAGPLPCIIQSPDRKCVCQLDDITQPCSCSITVICMKAWALTDVRSGQKYVSPVSAFALVSSCKIFTAKFVSVHIALQDIFIDFRAKAPGTMSNSVCGLRGGSLGNKKVPFLRENHLFN